MTLKVLLSTDSAPAQWGEGALLSYKEDAVTIHAEGSDLVQMAARKLVSQGLSFFTLEGEWELEQQWAFFQGAYDPKIDVQIDFAELSDDDNKELEARMQVSRWMRSMVNETPEVLAPQVLAQEAADFIQSLAPDNVRYQIV